MNDHPQRADSQPLEEREMSAVDVGIFVLCGITLGLLWYLRPQPLLLSGTLFINLAALAFYDFRAFRLPNILTLTLFLSGIAAVYIAPRYPVADHLIGAAVGLILFPAINFVYSRVRRRQGIGLGDAKLLAGLGLWLSWQSLPVLLLVASVMGLIFGLFLQFTSRDISRDTTLATPVPFGVFLSISGWLVWLFL